ncbi:MAG: MFS transporter [Spirochaetaceae bacterium]
MTSVPTPQVHSRLRVSLLNFVFYFSFGFAVPYFTLYLSRILVFEDGRTADFLVGVIMFIFNGLVLLSTPIAGYIADRYRIGSRVLSILALGVALGAALIAVPGFLAPPSLSTTLAVAIPGVVIAGFCLHPIIPLINSQTLYHLHHEKGESSEYGRVRMLGSVGFTVSTVIIGLILSITGQVAWTFTLFAVGYLTLAAIAATGVRAKPEAVHIPWQHLKRNKRFRLFLPFAFLASLGVNTSFLFTSYFLDEIGAGFILMGITFAASVIPEIPMLFRSGQLIRRLGAETVILIGVAAQALKLALFVFLASGEALWLFALVSLLHGVGFASLYSGSVKFVDDGSHADMRATYQNLFQLLWVTAVAVGGPIAGAILEAWNATVLMGVYSATLVLTGLYFAFFVRRAKTPKTSQAY